MQTHKGSGSKPESLLHSCTALLSRRDFNSCRDLAHRLPRSDPNTSLQLDRILAIADVLGAADHRVGTDGHLDWHAILQLRRVDAANRDVLRQQFKTLVRLLHPNKNKFPFAEDALMRVREAWSVLSDPAHRDDDHNNNNNAPSSARGGHAQTENGVGATASFWTMCPYCWYLHEYEKRYEDCSFRCGNCKRTFHGVAVKPPAPETVVKGKEQYYCYQVSLPLRYPCRLGGFQGSGNKRMRIKTVANRVRMRAFVSDSDLDALEENGDLEFAQGDGDVLDGVQ